MIRVLLAEDEPRILKDLCHLIETQPQFLVCGCAENGQEALELLQSDTCAPDVLITDIRMPGMDGLALLEKAKRLWPKLECVIISGYSEFSYAKRALVLGVNEYLLKPVKTQELFDLLEELATKITQAYLEKGVGTSMEMRSQFTVDAPKDEINVALLVCVGGFPIHTVHNTEHTDFWGNMNLEQILKAAVPQAQSWMMQGKTPVEKNIVLSFRGNALREVQAAVQQLFERFLTLQAPITMGYKKDFGPLYTVGPHAKALRKLLRNRTVTGLSQLLEIDALPVSYHSIEPFSVVQEEMLLLFERQMLAVFFSTLEKTVHEMETVCMPQALIWQFFCRLLERCCLILNLAHHADYESDLADAILISESFVALAKNLNGVFSDLFETAVNTQHQYESRDRVVRLVDSFIRQNYAQPINTQTLAEQFGLTPAYLSKIFRVYKSLSPVEYIVVLRIQKAQQLLSENEKMSVKEVAALVGYEDPFYFSKVFKKITGHAPKVTFTLQNSSDGGKL